MSGKLRIGALGNAKILRRFTQAPEMSAFGQIDVIATRSKESALVAVESYPNKKVLVGYEPVLELKDLDAIYVCLPAGLHYEWAKKALEAGKQRSTDKSHR